MLIVVTATKGGAGATTVAASIGLAPPGPSTLVDLTGDLSAAIGASHHEVGVADWLTSDAPTDRLDELLVPADDAGATLLGWGASVAEFPGSDRWLELFEWCAARAATSGTVVVDVGRHRSSFGATNDTSLTAATSEVVVTRACYLALRRRHVADPPPDGVVLVAEPGRAISPRDVERSIGAPILGTLAWDPAVARSIDAGLHTTGLPRSMRRVGRAVIGALTTNGPARRLAA